MRGHLHLLLGTAAGICAANAVGEPAAGAAFCMACMAGSVYPDIDVGTSRLGRKFRVVSFLAGHIFGHRGFIHTPANGLLLWYAITRMTDYLLPGSNLPVAEGFLLGFFLHLVQDTFTRGGIMWFFPSRRRIRLLKIKADGIWCFGITLILAMLCAGAFLWYIPASQTPMLI